jgi:hypothetical protein
MTTTPPAAVEPNQTLIDSLTVNTDPDPSFQPVTLKVDGKEVKVTSQAQLLEYAQKGAHYTKSMQALADERRQAENAIKAVAAAKKYEETENPEDLREFYTLLGKPKNEIEELMAMFAPPDDSPAGAPNPPSGGGDARDTKIQELEANVQRLMELVSDREGLTLDKLLEAVLDSNEQVKKALVGLDETTATDRREWMLEQSKAAVSQIIEEGRRKKKPYSPSEEKIIATKAVENTAAVIKRLGLDKTLPSVGPSPALVAGDSSTPLAEPRLPANADLGKMSTKEVGQFITGFAAKILHDSRLAGVRS